MLSVLIMIVCFVSNSNKLYYVQVDTSTTHFILFEMLFRAGLFYPTCLKLKFKCVIVEYINVKRIFKVKLVFKVDKWKINYNFQCIALFDPV